MSQPSVASSYARRWNLFYRAFCFRFMEPPEESVYLDQEQLRSAAQHSRMIQEFGKIHQHLMSFTKTWQESF
jgi:hypothetical protein